jgi:hypothetical protein
VLASNLNNESQSECHQHNDIDGTQDKKGKDRINHCSSNNSVPPTREVTIEGGNSFESNETFELIATLSQPLPNVTYSWSQLSGPPATFISTNDQEKASIKLPIASQVATLEFQIGVQYPDRRSVYAVKSITVNRSITAISEPILSAARAPTSNNQITAFDATQPTSPLASNEGFITASEPVNDASHLLGRIVSASGTAINNVQIIAIDTTELTQPVTSQSNSNGEFSLALEAQTQYVLQLTAPNFSNQVIPVLSPATNNTFKLNNLVMAERGDLHSIPTDGEQTVVAADGASVTFDKANFVDVNGQPLFGDMQLTVTPVDISHTGSIDAFPGLFLGASEDGTTPELIVSLGVVEFHFTHNGQPVNLASGATADILVPIYVNQYPDGQTIEAGHTTSLRSLNETTGIWSLEGTGTIVHSTDSPTGLAYQATVTHFSWWGSDVAISTPAGDTTPNTGVANAVIIVYAPSGIEGLAVIEATAQGLENWRGSTVSINVNMGEATPSLYIPANREVCFTAHLYFSSGTTNSTNQNCINVASQVTAFLYVELGEAGPIDVSVTPQLSDDTAFIQGFVNVQSPALRIAPATIETTVSYQLLSGILPAGLSLDIVDNVLNLVGVPTTAGEETFVIQALDDLGYTDDITVTYNVSSLSPPPIILDDTDRFYTGEITTEGGTTHVNINDLVTNIGGPINQWQEVSSAADQDECISMYSSAGIKGASADLTLPTSVSLNSATGQLTFNSAELWLGCLSAVNNEGSSILLFGFEIIDTTISQLY